MLYPSLGLRLWLRGGWARLTHLFVNNNHLTDLLGLDGCPRLRTLWAHSNHIAKLEVKPCLRRWDRRGGNRLAC